MKVMDNVEKRLYTALYLQHGISDQSLKQCRNYQRRQQVRHKRPSQADQCVCYNAIFPFTADLAHRAFVLFYLFLQDVNEHCWLWLR